MAGRIEVGKFGILWVTCTFNGVNVVVSKCPKKSTYVLAVIGCFGELSISVMLGVKGSDDGVDLYKELGGVLLT